MTLTCRAPHPDGARIPRFALRLHGIVARRVAFPCEPTGRVLDDPADVRPGHIAAVCPDPACGRVTEYRRA